MLKLFFNKNSPIVYGLEILGVLALGALLAKRWWNGRTILTQILFVICLLEYLFLRFCVMWRWYPSPPPASPCEAWRAPKTAFGCYTGRAGGGEGRVRGKYPGILLQFKRAMVPTSYILAITSIWLLLRLPGPMLYFSIILMTAIAHVNVILLYLHFKDNDPTPVNYYTRR